MVRILSNVQGRADSKNTSAEFSWPAISKMMQNITGQDIDYDSFKVSFDANPQLKNLVDRFDADGIVIKTKNKAEELGQMGNKDKAKAAVNASAKRAAAKMVG